VPSGPSASFGGGSRTGVKTRGQRLSGQAATTALLAVIVLVYVGQWLTGGWLTSLLLYWPPLTVGEPWRMLTALFVHSERSLFHILFNGYSLWVLGMLLERLLGAGRFLALFFTAGLGGSLAVLWLAPTQAVIGASGAIFGLFGALLVIQRTFGGTNPQLVIVLVLNLVLGFVVPGISWQAHIGGLVVGILLGWLLVKDRESAKPLGMVRLYGAVISGIVLLAVVRIVLF
jgi:membrane associated rhomboid family serine protease